jgi:starch synthase (maltosyl-transferring)
VNRKGPNNSLTSSENDPGSPWAIGSSEGGHKAVNPLLGTIDDFRALVKAAADHSIDVAIDIAFQCSPDHPYVKEHPEWFFHRLDGTIRCAENPPKRYEDIYPLDFECAQWQQLWKEMTDVVIFWADNGVKVFRVDNPHTKPYPFWQHLITEVRAKHPDTVFLAEAFARPKVMNYLAKVGFSQSYSYFTWRNNKDELTQYFSELYHTDIAEYLRPNLFANTPDILPDILQYGGRAAFTLRVGLAATLGASYGIYGPPFELCVSDGLPNSEEYRDSEKYQVRSWNRDDPFSIRDFIARINRVRRQNPALHSNRNLKFLAIDNRDMLAYMKSTDDGSNVILVVVNLDPYHTQSGFLHVPSWHLGVEHTYQVHDLISGVRYFWNGDTNFISLDPYVCPVHVFKLMRKVKTERDFDYFA